MRIRRHQQTRYNLNRITLQPTFLPRPVKITQTTNRHTIRTHRRRRQFTRLTSTAHNKTHTNLHHQTAHLKVRRRHTRSHTRVTTRTAKNHTIIIIRSHHSPLRMTQHQITNSRARSRIPHSRKPSIQIIRSIIRHLNRILLNNTTNNRRTLNISPAPHSTQMNRRLLNTNTLIMSLP